MRIVSYNINGIRAAIKKNFIQWLKEDSPDVVCLQEIKANSSQFNTHLFEDLGYHCFWFSAKKAGYSGVAILSKKKPISVVYGCGHPDFDDEGRVLTIVFDNIRILSCYFPSGSSGDIRQSFKINFLNYFYKFIAHELETHTSLLVCGDYNICHQAIDIHDPVRNKNSSGFLKEERSWMSSFLKLGFVDTFRELNDGPHNYSWWSYRAQSRKRNKGWRIDYHMLSSNIKNRIKKAEILSKINHSDHCPVLLELF